MWLKPVTKRAVAEIFRGSIAGAVVLTVTIFPLSHAGLRIIFGPVRPSSTYKRLPVALEFPLRLDPLKALRCFCSCPYPEVPLNL